MTIIAVRDGIMAVDSMTTDNGIQCGSSVKYQTVRDVHGGGYVSGAGSAGLSHNLQKQVAESGDCGDFSGDASLIWMLPDGTCRFNDGDGWYPMENEFHALGLGYQVAIGAMAHGATAKEAVEIAAKYVDGCGGEIHVLSVT